MGSSEVSVHRWPTPLLLDQGEAEHHWRKGVAEGSSSPDGSREEGVCGGVIGTTHPVRAHLQ